MDEKRYVVKEQSLKNLADIVREKTGTTTSYDIDEMVVAMDNVGLPELEELNATENKEYLPTSYGFSKVTVDVQPEREEISITENGEYTPSTYGFSKVEVDVQPTLEELYVDTNGEYTPTEYGYNKVIVDCPPGPPEEAFSITGDCKYRFYNGKWNWFIKGYGNKITTANITEASNMFASAAGLTEIPFTINIDDANLELCFSSMQKLEKCPKIRGSFDTSAWISARGMLESCYRLRDAEDLFDPAMLDHLKNVKVTSNYAGGYQVKFTNCYSLRHVPSWWYKQKLNPTSTTIPNSTIAGLYQGCFNSCYSLDEILDIPVWACNGAATSNMFGSTFYRVGRAKDITFETDNGTPIIAKWKSQTINLGVSPNYVGFCEGDAVTRYNSGITTATQVTDDETYQALKNDPDWWTSNTNYSRYNHDSAVRTINSLPDTSAYLASAGGSNTIQFRGSLGTKTDGGAINTLTAEEIAVAAAKGWTVTLS